MPACDLVWAASFVLAVILRDYIGMIYSTDFIGVYRVQGFRGS